MDFKRSLVTNQKVLYQQDIDENRLIVKENEEYRWLEYGGSSIQSLMNKKSPEQLITPVFQSLLLFLLLKKSSMKVLSLGLGGGAIERALAIMPQIVTTSVESSQPIIDTAKRYFYLPQKIQIVCQKAELFIQKTKTQYDVVLCDLFIGEKSPHFLFTASFYNQLKKITLNHAVVMINMQADTEAQLFFVLLIIKKYFPYIALIEFDDYSNIVLMCSSHEIPTSITLRKRLESSPIATCHGLDFLIQKMHYIPCSQN